MAAVMTAATTNVLGSAVVVSGSAHFGTRRRCSRRLDQGRPLCPGRAHQSCSCRGSSGVGKGRHLRRLMC
jgi:hypothetical protein